VADGENIKEKQLKKKVASGGGISRRR